MKYIIGLLCCFVLNGSCFGQLVFSESSWDDLLKQSAAEGKPIMVDMYASWCGPCKKMERDIFPIEEVGDFFNANFLVAKRNIDTPEGAMLEKRYSVERYPTFLFINADGKVLHQVIGYHDKDEFLAMGKAALQEKNQLAYLEKKYNAGDRSEVICRAYAIALFDAGKKGSQKPLLDFWKACEDKSDYENMSLLLSLLEDADNSGFDYIINHRSDFEEVFGSSVVNDRLQKLVYASIYQSKEVLSPEIVKAAFEKSFPEDAEAMSAYFMMSYYRQAKDWPKYVDATLFFLDNAAEDAATFNDLSWSIVENTDDKKQLKRALKYAKRANQLQSHPAIKSTVAHIYAKLNKRKKAKDFAKQSIVLADEYEYDSRSVEALLKSLD